MSDEFYSLVHCPCIMVRTGLTERRLYALPNDSVEAAILYLKLERVYGKGNTSFYIPESVERGVTEETQEDMEKLSKRFLNGLGLESF